MQNVLSSLLLSRKHEEFNKTQYECDTWSVTVGEERRLRAFNKKVLRRQFGPKREEIRERKSGVS